MQGIGADIVSILDRYHSSYDRSRERGLEQQKQSRMAEIGGIAGKGDYEGAASKALAYGDLPTGSSLLQLAQGKKKQAQEDEATRLDRVTRTLYAANDPQSYARAIASLEASGEQFDPHEKDFNYRETLIAEGLSIADQIKMKGEGYTLGEGQVRFDGGGKQIAAGPPKSARASDSVVTDIDGQRGLLDKNTGQFKPLGKSPVRGRPGLTPTELKFQRESENDQLNLGQTITSLERAAELSQKTFEGTGAGAKAYIGSKLPGGSMFVDKGGADATTEYTSLMSPEAIKEMAATLKGATTDFELRKFESILSDPSQPNSIKIKVINRMLTLARQKHELEGRRLQDFEKGDQAPEQQGMGEPGEIPSEAISDLLADPSAAAEFDEVFGAGASQQILENQ